MAVVAAAENGNVAVDAVVVVGRKSLKATASTKAKVKVTVKVLKNILFLKYKTLLFKFIL